MNELVASCAVELKGVPEWVHLMPAGEIRPNDGRAPWRLADAAAVVKASLLPGRDLPIDYEHQTQFADRNGQPAPAAGWIKELQARADGIWGRVEWTAKARKRIEAREYRYLSPVFTHDKDSREVRRIRMAGLTNLPALDLTALAKKDEAMNELLQQLRKLLGLADDAAADAVCKALEDLVAKAKAAPPTGEGKELATIAKALGLDEASDAAAIAAAAAKLKDAAAEPDPAKYVKVEDYNVLAKRVGELEESGSTAKATAAVDEAIKAGKLLPAQRDWALAYAKRDAAGFAAFVEKQPQIVKPGGGTAPGVPAKRADGALSPEEKAVCKAMGLTEAEFLASAKALDAREEEAA